MRLFSGGERGRMILENNLSAAAEMSGQLSVEEIWRTGSAYQSWKKSRGESTDSDSAGICALPEATLETEIAFVIFPSNRGGCCVGLSRRYSWIISAVSSGLGWAK